MTDNEIIKALAHCSNPSNGCSGCPLFSSAWDEYGKSIAKCEVELIRYAFDLINHQKAEIEKLQNTTVVNLQNTVLESSAILGELEIRREQIRTEAIKEFAVKVKNGCGRVKIEGKSMLVCQESSFDYLVKQMLE